MPSSLLDIRRWPGVWSWEPTFLQTLISNTSGSFPMPHVKLIRGESIEDYVKAFDLDQIREIKLIGLESIERDGNAMKVLSFEGTQGTVKAFVDAKTNLITEVTIGFGSVKVNMTMQPRIYETLPEGITFDPTGRKLVEVLKLEVGDPAPDFELPTLTGEMVRLSDLKGSMVVLDFWATWCGPCMRGLPVVDRFARWAESSGLAVKVLAIDSFERLPTDAQKKQKIAQVWKAKGFSFPTLLDFSQTVAGSYEVGPIPHGVVIDTEGRIHSIKVGYDPRLYDKLKQEAQEILMSDG